MTDNPPHSPRPLPVLNNDNRAFWTGGAEGRLMIYRCQACTYYVHPPVRFCPKCESRDVEPEQVSGGATVEVFTINYKEWVPGLDTPYVLALVRLDEQDDVRLPTNIICCPAESVHAGMRVRVRFEQYEDVWPPLFAPENSP